MVGSELERRLVVGKVVSFMVFEDLRHFVGWFSA